MKRLILIFTAVISLTTFLTSCGGGQEEKTTKWEYKIVRANGIIDPDLNEDIREFASKYVIIDDEKLNKLGDDGWELVDTYSELETVYPNWGNEKYVTGIQPNVRTMSVVLILKRPVQDKKAEKKEESTEKKKQ